MHFDPRKVKQARAEVNRKTWELAEHLDEIQRRIEAVVESAKNSARFLLGGIERERQQRRKF